MKTTMVPKNRAMGVVVVIAGLLPGGNAWGQTASQSPLKEQCSLAVVSRTVGSGTPVCDGAVVEQMAKTGGGSIDVGTIKGDISLHTGGGSIEVHHANGKIVAETGGGSGGVRGCDGSDEG